MNKIYLLSIAFFLFLASLSSLEASSRYRIQTNMGDIVIELYEDKAPQTVQNFKAYADEGKYDGTTFHRVIPNFMIQGGGYNENGEPIATYPPIQNEADNGLKNSYGTVAMARTQDPNSANSQFFINLFDNKSLDHTGKTNSKAWGYAVFGRVVDGMDVAKSIAGVGTNPSNNKPAEPVIILSVSSE